MSENDNIKEKSPFTMDNQVGLKDKVQREILEDELENIRFVKNEYNSGNMENIANNMENIANNENSFHNVKSENPANHSDSEHLKMNGSQNSEIKNPQNSPALAKNSSIQNIETSNTGSTAENVNKLFTDNSESSANIGNKSAGQGFQGLNNVQNKGINGTFDNTGINEPKKKKKGKFRIFKRVISVIVVLALCAGSGFLGATYAVKHNDGGLVTKNIKISGSTESLNAASAIAEKTMPSVVGISTVSQNYYQTIFGLQQGTLEGVGTGIIVDANGYILTNAHVVEMNGSPASKITVDLYNGKTYDGRVLWSGSSQNLDLAIVKIDAKGLSPAELGNSDKVKIGDYALAIGNPLGLELERSVSKGIISGLNRTITATDGNSSSRMEGLIQTDASINSGNSGGPLINSKGQVIGINTATATSAEGLGFSIPINSALTIIKEIKEKGTYEQSYIGIVGMDVSSVIAKYQTDFKAQKGVYIQQIYTDSPAAKAGLREGDIITHLNGKAISGMSALKSELVKYRPGDKINLTVERNKSSNKVEITLISMSDVKTPNLQMQQKPMNNDPGDNRDSGDNSDGVDNGNDDSDDDGSNSYLNPFSDLFGN